MDEDTYNNELDNLEWCTAKYNNNYGTKSKRLSLAHKGKFTGKDSSNARKIICITTGKSFDTSKEGSEYYSCCRQHISKSCSGKIKYCGKLADGTELQWLYYEDYLKLQC